MNAAEKWNEFLDKIIEARELWGEYQEIRTLKGVNIEGLDVPSMRHMSSTLHKAKFDIALPRLVDYWRRYGGIEGIIMHDSTGSKFDADLGKQKEKEVKENGGGETRARRVKSTPKV